MALKALKKLFNFKGENVDNIVMYVVTFALGFIIVQSLIDGLTHSHVHEGYEGQKELLLLHMDGCPHCVKLMPHWDAAVKENNTSIKMRALEHKEGDGPALCKKHKVTGFPTMMLLSGGEKVKSYSGARTKGGILDFLHKNA